MKWSIFVVAVCCLGITTIGSANSLRGGIAYKCCTGPDVTVSVSTNGTLVSAVGVASNALIYLPEGVPAITNGLGERWQMHAVGGVVEWTNSCPNCPPGMYGPNGYFIGMDATSGWWQIKLSDDGTSMVTRL